MSMTTIVTAAVLPTIYNDAATLYAFMFPYMSLL